MLGFNKGLRRDDYLLYTLQTRVFYETNSTIYENSRVNTAMWHYKPLIYYKGNIIHDYIFFQRIRTFNIYKSTNETPRFQITYIDLNYYTAYNI